MSEPLLLDQSLAIEGVEAIEAMEANFFDEIPPDFYLQVSLPSETSRPYSKP